MNLNIFRANLFTPGLNGRWGLPRIYWGPPGVGKSAKTSVTVRSMGLMCLVILSSIRDPSDFLGLPVPQINADGTTVVTYSPPDWAVEAAKHRHVVVFFDEISTAAPSVQAALLRVILDGVVGGLQLPPEVRFVAAANPEKLVAAGGFDMSAPLANRFGHENTHLTDDGKGALGYDDLDEWVDWLIGSGESAPEVEDTFDAAAEEARVLELWPSAYARARGEIVGFLKSAAGGPGVLFNMPEQNDPRASRAWASPRSWECAVRALASGRVHGLSEMDVDRWMASHVGVGPIAQFRAFISEANMPDPEALLDGKVGWEHDPARLDRTLSVLTGCVSLVTSPGCANQPKRMEKLWEIMTPIADQAADVCVPAVQTLIRKNLAFGKAAAKPLAKMRPIMKAAGVIR